MGLGEMRLGEIRSDETRLGESLCTKIVAGFATKPACMALVFLSSACQRLGDCGLVCLF